MNTIFCVPLFSMFLCVFPSIQKINTIETKVPDDVTRKLPKIAFGSFICSLDVVSLSLTLFGYNRS